MGAAYGLLQSPDSWTSPSEGRSVGLSFAFDDGTNDHYEYAAPILERGGAIGIFYIITGLLGAEGYLDYDQVHHMARRGHVIAAHSHRHLRLDKLDNLGLRFEMQESRRIVSDLAGKPVEHFAPPGGFFDKRVQTIAYESGFRFFRTSEWGYNRAFDPTHIEVVPVSGALPDRFVRLAMMGKAERQLKAFYRLKEASKRFVTRLVYGVFRDAGTRLFRDRPPA